MEPSPPLQTVIGFFADKASAERAAQGLIATGLAAARIHFHERGESPRNGAGVVLDEYASGGFFTSFKGLLEGLLGSRSAPGEARSYADLVQFEGVAVSVDAPSTADAAGIEAQLRQSGATRVARSASR